MDTTCDLWHDKNLGLECWIASEYRHHLRHCNITKDETALICTLFKEEDCTKTRCEIFYSNTASYNESCINANGAFYDNRSIKFGCKDESSFADFKQYRE